MLTTAHRKHWHSHETYKRVSDFGVVRTPKHLLFASIASENADDIPCVLGPHGESEGVLKSSLLSPVALRVSLVPTCSAQRLYSRGDYGGDFVSLCSTAAKRPVLMLLFGLHLKVSWSFLLLLADVIGRSLNKTKCDKDDCCIVPAVSTRCIQNWNSEV